MSSWADCNDSSSIRGIAPVDVGISQPAPAPCSAECTRTIIQTTVDQRSVLREPREPRETVICLSS